MMKTWHVVQMFDARALVLATKVRLGFFWQYFNFRHFCSQIFPGKERVPVPWERGCTFTLVLRVISAFKMVGRPFIAKVGHKMFVGEMIDGLSDQLKKKIILAKMGSHNSHGSQDSHGLHRGLHGSLACRFGRP